jgi:aspartyl/glutamyl-tRNA(Asn/Gln) amidotransferase C subunit
MTKDDIMQLGELSRIALKPAEIETLHAEIDAILAYVSTVQDLAGEGEVGHVVGARYNVLRADEVTTTPGAYTETLLSAAPQREGNFLSVKKILNQS